MKIEKKRKKIDRKVFEISKESIKLIKDKEVFNAYGLAL
jgi:hypothetical protein